MLVFSIMCLSVLSRCALKHWRLRGFWLLRPQRCLAHRAHQLVPGTGQCVAALWAPVLCSRTPPPQLGHLLLHGWIQFPMRLRSHVLLGSAALSLSR